MAPDCLLTGGQLYDEACSVWNAAVQRRPALIARCRSVKDVQAAVTAAGTCRLRLAVRGGGYDWAGRALIDDGLVVDLSQLRGVRIDGDHAVVGGGATCSDVLDVAADHGLSAATATVGAVGMTGLTLGGGYGRISGQVGLAADNLLSATVVLADGSVVEADEDHELDLFWALRGAGGNFGVVTQMRVRLHRIPEVTTGLIAFPRAQAQSVLSGLADLMADGPDEFTPIFGLMAGPEAPQLYVSPTWGGDAAAGERVVDQIRALGDPVTDQVTRMSVAQSVHLVDEQFGPGAKAAIRTRSVPSLTDGVIDALLAAADGFPSPRCAVNLHHLHGAATRPQPDATAFGLRREHYTIEILPSWTDGDGAAERAWADTTARSLDAVSLPGGYANIMGPDDAERAALFYGENAARVLAAKRRYDPDGVFCALTLPVAPPDDKQEDPS